MMMGYSWIVFLVALAAVEGVTRVNQCKPKNGYIEDNVDISKCKGTDSCKLQKKSNIQISILFTPEEEVKNLRAKVSAELVKIPLPFIGVDGSLVCDKIFTPDGKNKAPCPLKAGEKYLYRDSFDVLQVYPNVKVIVRWALVNADTKNTITCFEVPAEIVN